MLDDVPEPVWKTSIGNSASQSPRATSAAAAAIASAFAWSSRPRWARTRAPAPLISASAGDELALDRLAGDREVLDRALGLGPPLRGGGHADLAHRVLLDAVTPVARSAAPRSRDAAAQLRSGRGTRCGTPLRGLLLATAQARRRPYRCGRALWPSTAAGTAVLAGRLLLVAGLLAGHCGGSRLRRAAAGLAVAEPSAAVCLRAPRRPARRRPRCRRRTARSSTSPISEVSKRMPITALPPLGRACSSMPAHHLVAALHQVLGHALQLAAEHRLEARAHLREGVARADRQAEHLAAHPLRSPSRDLVRRYYQHAVPSCTSARSRHRGMVSSGRSPPRSRPAACPAGAASRRAGWCRTSSA